MGESRTSYWVTDNYNLIRKTLHLSPDEQKKEIESAGRRAIYSYNQTDFVKNRVAVEIQFGKYSFIAYDLFVKHLAFYVGDAIDVGIEVLPMKSMQQEMSSGPGYYEGALYDLARQGRGFLQFPWFWQASCPETWRSCGLTGRFVFAYSSPMDLGIQWLEGVQGLAKRNSCVITGHYGPESAVTLFQGDRLQLLEQIPDAAASLVVTSPPYNIGKKYEKRLSFGEYLRLQRDTLRESARILSPKGSLCWQVGNHIGKDGEVFPLDIFVYRICKRLGLKLRNRIIWSFDHGLHCRKRLSGRYETILWFTKSDEYVFNLDAIRVPKNTREEIF